jgi:N-acetylmuramoyl-L-alanine amidase
MTSLIDYPSPNFDDRDGVAPVYIILHYTGMETAQGALDRLCSQNSKVSAHYTIDEDGTLYRHVAEDKRAWHAGFSYWRGETDLNRVSIGIELVNPGHEWGYRPFTGHQLKSVAELCHDICQRYEIEPDCILAHADIAPARKLDPGELFPWRDLALHGVGVWPDPSDEDVVKAAGINIERALHDYGYDPRVKFKDNLVAFQRHFVPEAFVQGFAGESESFTRQRLYALLAGHVLEPKYRT